MTVHRLQLAPATPPEAAGTAASTRPLTDPEVAALADTIHDAAQDADWALTHLPGPVLHHLIRAGRTWLVDRWQGPTPDAPVLVTAMPDRAVLVAVAATYPGGLDALADAQHTTRTPRVPRPESEVSQAGHRRLTLVPPC